MLNAGHECLGDAEIVELINGQITPGRAEDVLTDVEGCPLCSILVARAGQLRGRDDADFSEGRCMEPATEGTLVRDRYRILRFLGRGGMGEVYEAEDMELEERVALKIMRAHTEEGQAALERFRREVRLARQVVHPRVCRVLEFGGSLSEREPNLAFLTMEYLEGTLLSDRLKGNAKLSTTEALGIARDLCDGLGAIHAMGLLHRDVKPNNVMLCESGPVIFDFGVARPMERTSDVQPTTSPVGTPDYMAPEQIRGDPLTEAADIYSLGVLLFRLLTGRLPFEGSHALARAVKRLNSPCPRPSRFAPDLSPRVDEVVLRCLESDPDNRFASVQELELELALVSLDASAASGRSHSVPKRGWRAIAILLPLLLLAGGLELASGREVKPPAPEIAAPPRAKEKEPRVVSAHFNPRPVESKKASAAEVQTKGAVEKTAAISPPTPRREVSTSSSTKRNNKDRVSRPSQPESSDCQPPFFHDEEGFKIFKKECL